MARHHNTKRPIRNNTILHLHRPKLTTPSKPDKRKTKLVFTHNLRNNLQIFPHKNQRIKKMENNTQKDLENRTCKICETTFPTRKELLYHRHLERIKRLHYIEQYNKKVKKQ